MPAPGRGPGHWAGAPSATLDDDGTVWLAYRLRRPVDDGRGVEVVVARSRDGVSFEQVAQVGREAFGAASLERPALVRRPGWRLAPLPELRHAGLEALVGRGPRRRPPPGAARGAPHGGAPRQRRRGGQGPGGARRPTTVGRCGCAATRSTSPATRTG